MGINLIAPINDRSYGVVGYNLLKSLYKNGTNVSLFPIGNIFPLPNIDIGLIRETLDNSEYFNKSDPCIRLWHQFDMTHFVGNGPKIGFTIFEINKFSQKEKHQLAALDYLIVCSEWAKTVVENEVPSLKNRIIIYQLGVDIDLLPKQNILSRGDTYNFVNIGKLEIRKGHDILGAIFNKAFRPDDNVCLNISWNNPFMSPEEIQEWQRFYLETDMGRAGKIMFMPWFDNQADLFKAIQKMDCGIFPSRAEGWNLELAECISLGLPVIATNYSAHTEFCNSKNSYLVDIDTLEPAFDGKWFHGTGEWAYIGTKQINDFIDKMRFCYDNKITINNGGYDFSWDGSTKKLITFLSQLH